MTEKLSPEFVEENKAKIHLDKTLWAMRLIAFLTHKHDVLKAVEKDMEALA